MEMTPKPALVYRGAKEICTSVGLNWKEIVNYVEHHGLPAFKVNGKGAWIALPDDLLEWVKQQREREMRR